MSFRPAPCSVLEPRILLAGDGLSITAFDPADWSLVDAATINAGELVLTPNDATVKGAAWYRTPLDLDVGDVSIRFTFRIDGGGDPDQNGEGFAFVLQRAGLDAIATQAGPTLGAQDLGGGSFDLQSALLFDTRPATYGLPLNSGDTYTAWLELNRLSPQYAQAELYLGTTDTRPGTPVFTTDRFDYNFGGDPLLGFTASTSGYRNAHVITSLDVDGSFDGQPDTTPAAIVDAVQSDGYAGINVALAGNLGVVAAVTYSDLLRIDARTGRSLGTLDDSGLGSETFKQLGTGLDMSDRYIVAGAPYSSLSGSAAGAAAVYDTQTGDRLRTLPNPVSQAGDLFGQGVEVNGSLALITAPSADRYDASPTGGLIDAGTTYLYDLETGNLLRQLTPSDAAAGQTFGTAAALGDGVAAVQQRNTGDAVYLFDTDTGTQLHRITRPAGYLFFGQSLAIGAGELWASARTTDNTTTVFRYDLATGNLLGTLDAPAADDLPGAYDQPNQRFAFGAHAIDLDADPSTGNATAAVGPFVYTRNPAGDWSLDRQLRPELNQTLNNHAALDDGRVLLAGTNRAGHDRADRRLQTAYLFTLPGTTEPSVVTLDDALAVNENAGTLDVPVRRLAGDGPLTVTVRVTTADGDTATLGSDVAALTQSVSFTGGPETQTVTVTLLDDALPEPDESFRVTLTADASVATPNDTTAVTILDDDTDTTTQTFDTVADYPTFADTAGLSLTGSAQTRGSALELHAFAPTTAGAAWLNEPVSIDSNRSFQTAFTYRATKHGFATPDGLVGGEGLAFVVQADGPGLQPTFAGELLGYARLDRSLAIELDMRRSNAGDTADQELAVVLNGNHTTPIAATASPIDLDNGSPRHVWIDYAGPTDTLRVYLSDTPTKPDTPTLTAVVNLADVLGNANGVTPATLGFTAATSGYFGRHELDAWSLDVSQQGATVVTPARSRQSITETGEVLIHLQRAGDLTGVTTVNLQVLDFTFSSFPDPARDFPLSFTQREVTFAPGESLKAVRFEMLDDAIPEPDEVIPFRLFPIAGGTVGYAPDAFDTPDANLVGVDTGYGLLRVQDNDVTPTQSVQFDADPARPELRVNESDDNLRIPVTRTGDLSQRLRVAYNLLPFDAASGIERDLYRGFNPGEGTLVFEPGQSLAFINDIQPINDTLTEDDESFVLYLTRGDRPVAFGRDGDPWHTVLTVVDDDRSDGFTYDGFANATGLTINGYTTRPLDVVRLVESRFTGVNGSVFRDAPLDLTGDASFETDFTIRLPEERSNQGDGFTFTIQGNDRFALAPYAGNSLGYTGIGQSVAVEFDLIQNDDLDDRDGSHIGINVNGSVRSIAQNAIPILDRAGLATRVWVRYDDATHTLGVRLLESGPDVLATTIDLPAIVGPLGYAGFTAATSGYTSTIDLERWSFTHTGTSVA